MSEQKQEAFEEVFTSLYDQEYFDDYAYDDYTTLVDKCKQVYEHTQSQEEDKTQGEK